MNLSPTASSTSTSSTPATSSSASNSTLHPTSGFPSFRRRSVDTGGLNLVVNDHTGSGSGRGYGGWAEKDREGSPPTNVAELVMAWKEKSDRMIDEAHPPITDSVSPPAPDKQARKAEFIDKLTQWGFDGTNLSLDDVLFCANLLFELLWSIEGMENDIKVSFDVVPVFLSHVSKLYRKQSRYHNFQHALDVLQAMYYYLHQAGCVPDLHILNVQSDRDEQREVTDRGEVLRPRASWRPQRTKGDPFLQKALGNEDIFALFIASIGHDIGHPGVNNEFLFKAKTPVAELFSERSVLESMHSTLLFQVMKKHGMGHLLDRVPARPPFFLKHHPRSRLDSDPGIATSTTISQIGGEITSLPNNSQPELFPETRLSLKKSMSVSQASSKRDHYERGTEFKTLLNGIILATDMGVHKEWMETLKVFNQNLDQSAQVSSNIEVLEEEGSNVSYETKLLLCQALIKCADISNPSRPPPACKNWSLSLLAEWEQQVLLEKSLDLPHSFINSSDPLKLIKGQLGFLKGCTLPLLEETLLAIPAMSVFAQQCRDNISMWEAKEAEFGEISDEKIPMSTDVVLPPPSPIAIDLPTALPDVSTIFALALPPCLQMSAPEISWPQENTTVSISTIASPEPELVPSIQTSAEEDTNGTCSSGPPSPLVETSLCRIHLSHTELPQVSIPTGQSVLSTSSGFNQIKSGSTIYNSPLFSPPSTTSSTSRSDASSPSPSTLKNPRTDDLRAVLDAHQGRWKTRGHWYRRSWQGDVSLLSPATSQVSIAASSAITSDHTPDDEGVVNGS